MTTEPADAAASPLPVRAVTLFSSGVSYTLREGEIDEGDVTVPLTFRTSQVSDILKSLVVLDEAGGAQAATFPSRDPVGRALQSFAVDVTGNPSRADLLRQVRGVPVRVQTVNGETLEGRVVGIETREEVVSEREITVETLTLLGEDGLTAVTLDRVRNLRLMDERLDREFREALITLASGSDDARRIVTLRFTGAARRAVRVGYIAEAPLWKMSYRLVLDDAGEDTANVAAQPYLQGWALVENTSDSDWNGVQLSLVSGQPVSFIQDLYQPLYVPRPVVPPDVTASPYPQAHDGAVESVAADYDDEYAESDMREESFNSFGGGGPKAARAMSMPAPAPVLKRASMKGSAPSQASGQGVGELFEYRISHPVTLPRQQAAMIPVVSEDFEGEKLSLYNVNNDARYPLNAFRLKNNTSLHLKAGPITVFDGGVYAGDARMGEVPPGDNRLITYAVDLAIDVERQQSQEAGEEVTLTVRRGVLFQTRRYVQETLFRIKSKATKPRLVYVEHPYQAEWKLIEPAAFTERTTDQYRFAVKVPAGEAVTLRVREQQPISHSFALLHSDLNVIYSYSQYTTISEKLRQTLTTVIERRRKIQELEEEATERESAVSKIHKEQERMRKNMGALDKDTPLYRRYVEDLDRQETRLQELHAKVDALRTKTQTAQHELETFLDTLEIDA